MDSILSRWLLSDPTYKQCVYCISSINLMIKMECKKNIERGYSFIWGSVDDQCNSTREKYIKMHLGKYPNLMCNKCKQALINICSKHVTDLREYDTCLLDTQRILASFEKDFNGNTFKSRYILAYCKSCSSSCHKCNRVFSNTNNLFSCLGCMALYCKECTRFTKLQFGIDSKCHYCDSCIPITNPVINKPITKIKTKSNKSSIRNQMINEINKPDKHNEKIKEIEEKVDEINNKEVELNNVLENITESSSRIMTNTTDRLEDLVENTELLEVITEGSIELIDIASINPTESSQIEGYSSVF